MLFLRVVKGFSQLFWLAFSYRSTAILVILCNVLFVTFNLLSLVLFAPFLKLIFSDQSEVELAAVSKPHWESSTGLYDYSSNYYDFLMAHYIADHGKAGALAFICVTVLAAYFLKNFFRYAAIYFKSFMRIAVVRDLRSQLFHKSIHLPLAYYSEKRKGDLLSRMTADLNEIEAAVVYVLEMIFREPVSIVFHLIILFSWSVELTLFSLVLMPLSALAISSISKSLKRTSSKSQQQMGVLLSITEELLGGINIIKAFSAEESALKRFSKANDHHQKVTTRTFRKRDLSSPLNEFLGACVLVSLVYFGGNIVLHRSADASEMTSSEFIAFILVFSQLLRPVNGLANGMAFLGKATASIDRINGILDLEEQIKEVPSAQDKTTFTTALTFKDVSFSYGQQAVLNAISFELKKGQTIALVGESGSGKSTISGLIPRFYDVQEGAVLIDGTDVRHLKKRSLRSLIALVTQESILFNDTIANNIAFGNPSASRETIERAAKVANAHSFIVNMEDGYETVIGDRGNKLSGGQKQRISIARAVVSNAPLLILDEATSALDTESEKFVQEALDNVMKSRTSLVIAHRLSTVRHADVILVLKEGRIVEQGTHDDLIARGGYYRILCEIQQII